MSMRSFVACSSVFLMAWLALAYLHTPVTRAGVDPVALEVENAGLAAEDEVKDLTVSVSPSGVVPD